MCQTSRSYHLTHDEYLPSLYIPQIQPLICEVCHRQYEHRVNEGHDDEQA